MKESLIQTKIKTKLEASGWMVIKLIQTSCNGITDQLALKEGKAVFIEVKQPGKKPTDLQLHRHKQLREKGFEVVVATDVSDILFLCPSC